MSTDHLEPPRSTGRMAELRLTGMLFPWNDDQPVLVSLTGSPLFHLPLFDGPEELIAAMERGGVEFASIKQVQDGPEFLSSVPPDIVIITGLHYTDQGTVRYFRVLR